MLPKLNNIKNDTNGFRTDDLAEDLSSDDQDNKIISFNNRRLQQILGQKTADQLGHTSNRDLNPVDVKSMKTDVLITMNDNKQTRPNSAGSESYDTRIQDENLSKGIYALQIAVIAMSFGLVLLITALI